MPKRNWATGPAGGTPISATALNGIEVDLDARLPVWAPSTVYEVGARVISPNNDIVTCLNGHTSGVTYVASNWATSSTFLKPALLGVANGIATLDASGKVPSASVPGVGQLNQIGTFAGRPAANTVAVGVTYYTTDTGEVYRSDGTAWVSVGPGGNNLGNTSLLASFQTTSATYVDVTAFTVTFTAGSRPVEIILDCNLANLTAAKYSTAAIVLDSVVVQTIESFHGTAGKWLTHSKRFIKTGLVAGSTHVAKVQLKAEATSTALIDGSATAPSILTVQGR